MLRLRAKAMTSSQTRVRPVAVMFLAIALAGGAARSQVDVHRPVPLIVTDFISIENPDARDCERYARAALELRAQNRPGWSNLLRVAGEAGQSVDPNGPSREWMEIVRAEGEEAFDRASATNALAWRALMGDQDAAKARALFEDARAMCDHEEEVKTAAPAVFASLYYSVLNGLMFSSSRLGEHEDANRYAAMATALSKARGDSPELIRDSLINESMMRTRSGDHPGAYDLLLELLATPPKTDSERAIWISRHAMLGQSAIKADRAIDAIPMLETVHADPRNLDHDEIVSLAMTLAELYAHVNRRQSLELRRDTVLIIDERSAGWLAAMPGPERAMAETNLEVHRTSCLSSLQGAAYGGNPDLAYFALDVLIAEADDPVRRANFESQRERVQREYEAWLSMQQRNP